MGWWMLAGAAASAIGGAASRNAAAAQQANAQVEQLRQQTEQNTAGLEANLKNLTRTNVRAGLVRLQAGLQARQAAGALSDIGIQTLAAQGEASAAAGATGSVGGSVQAVAADINRQAGQASLVLQADADVQQTNFQQQIQDLYVALDNNFYTPRVNAVQKFKGESFGDMLLNMTMNFAGTYAQQRMSLGLGEQSNGFASSYINTGNAFQGTSAGNGTLGAFLNR